MREILFRGKCLAGNWHYGVPLVFADNFVCITAPHACNKSVIPETVGQFTGLTDKNGTRIFEGDIIKDCDYDHIHTVRYFGDEDYPAFDCDPEIQFCECNGLSHLCAVSAIEVIGNIHDNPELLKGEQI